jgi:hypothetical protein
LVIAYEALYCSTPGAKSRREIGSLKIEIDSHSLERAKERGTNEEEIRDVLHTGFSIPAKYGRLGKAKIYDFRKKRREKYYEQKRVEVFYFIEKGNIITVTVYVFYGKWESKNANTL